MQLLSFFFANVNMVSSIENTKFRFEYKNFIYTLPEWITMGWILVFCFCFGVRRKEVEARGISFKRKENARNGEEMPFFFGLSQGFRSSTSLLVWENTRRVNGLVYYFLRLGPLFIRSASSAPSKGVTYLAWISQNLLMKSPRIW